MKSTFQPLRPRFWLAACALALLQACASGPGANPADPLEPLNRSIFAFNEGADRVVFKPVATAYQTVTPSPIRTGIGNFFGNVSDVWSLVNNALQLKGKESLEMLMRVSMNTTFGLVGVLDVATEMRLERHREDFGQTLGRYGVRTGPYLVLPLLGSSTVRDTAGFLVDSQFDFVTQTTHIPSRNSLTVLRLVDTRARLLGAGDVLDQAALDKYSFTRDVYLRRRNALIGAGSSAGEKEERYDLPEGGTPPPESSPGRAPQADAPAQPGIQEPATPPARPETNK
jgi:phospholipid-binding lipoprotein MlaA